MESCVEQEANGSWVKRARTQAQGRKRGQSVQQSRPTHAVWLDILAGPNGGQEHSRRQIYKGGQLRLGAPVPRVGDRDRVRE